MCVRASGAGLAWAALALLALLAVATAAADDAAKRAESEYMSPMPFVLGSRYGRSQPRLMSPRNDRFFMGSRYGKRSEPWGGGGSGWAARAARSLTCQPLAVNGLYRCSPAAVPVDFDTYHYNKRSEESRESEEKN